jgi:hypothetical protein
MRPFQGAVIAVSLLIVVDGVTADTITTDIVSLDKPVHFYAPDGSDVLTAPGDYRITAGSPGLRLMSEMAGDRRALLIDAIVTELDVDAHEPVALAIRLREDEYHIILLMPGKKVHEAVGSSSGVLTRGTLYKPLTAAQIKAALDMKRTSIP